MEILKPMVHQALGKSYINRDKQSIHASDVTQKGWCPREHYIYEKFDIATNTKFISTATKITWEYGRFIENELRNVWLRDIMVGTWKCAKCSIMYGSNLFTTLQGCKICYCNTLKNYVYLEPVFTIENLNIQGSPDCFVYTLKHDIVPIEIKTIDKDAFYILSKPSIEHVLRCQFYLKLISESIIFDSFGKGKINTNFMQIVYFSKSFGLKDETVKDYNPLDKNFSPIKEYTVVRSDDSVQYLWDKLLDYSTSIGNNNPPARICPKITCARAKQCAVRDICFTQME